MYGFVRFFLPWLLILTVVFYNAYPWENGNGVQITGTTGKQLLGVRLWMTNNFLFKSTVKLLCVSANDTF